MYLSPSLIVSPDSAPPSSTLQYMSCRCVLNFSEFTPWVYACAYSCTRHDLLYASFLLLGILGTFKSYPTLSDPGLFLSFISLFPEIYPRACSHFHATAGIKLFFVSCGRSSLPGRNGAFAPTRLPVTPTVPPSMDWNGHGKRKLLLREYACLRACQWQRTSRLRLGRLACGDWGGEGGVGGHTRIVVFSSSDELGAWLGDRMR